MIDETDAPEKLADEQSRNSEPEGDPFLALTISLLNRSDKEGIPNLAPGLVDGGDPVLADDDGGICP